MKIKPVHDRIVIKPEESETQTASGIVLPDTAQEKPQRGEVVAVGPGKQLDSGKLAEMEVKVADVVLYGKYSGTEVKLNGEEYVFLRQEDVLAIVEGAKRRMKKAKKTAKKGKK
ncbi:MAG: co-chaperone GroES [Armatimonadetes bacterium]|nr:co-chaperone GroES [Armatimonadota bacterium]